MKFDFIYKNRVDYSVVKMCDLLDVSKSGYYKWLKTKASKGKREKVREKIKRLIRKVFHGSYGTYGSPRIWNELRKLGIKISEKTVGRYMREMGLSATPGKRFVVTTDSNHSNPIYPNLLNRKFNPDRPDRAWVTDVTYIWTSEGWLYLATVMDLYSRKIVGWNMDKTLAKELCIVALDRALAFRNPSKNLIHHSDRGSQYTSNEYIERLKEQNIQISMSRRGNCWDNACIESFHASIKKELIYRMKFKTREEATKAIWHYIMSFYNERRIHSTLGYISPNQYERTYWRRGDKEAN
ncbi:IS3 family transposase [Virgibacillus sp. FSP13]